MGVPGLRGESQSTMGHGQDVGQEPPERPTEEAGGLRQHLLWNDLGKKPPPWFLEAAEGSA